MLLCYLYLRFFLMCLLIIWLIECIPVSYTHLGLALGSTYAHSTMITVLASLGWVGTLIWVAFTFYLGKNKKGIFYTIVCTIHVLALILFGNGFFPFYGVQNILIIELFDIYASKSQYITNA